MAVQRETQDSATGAVQQQDDGLGVDQRSETEGPRQTVRVEPFQEDIGPHFPSGMSAPEAAVAGATANMDESQLAKLRGEEPASRRGEITEGSEE